MIVWQVGLSVSLLVSCLVGHLLVGWSVCQSVLALGQLVSQFVGFPICQPACLPVFLHVPKLPRKDNSYAPRGVQNDCNSGLEKAFTIMHNQLMSTSTIKPPITNWVRKTVAVKAGACHKKQNFQAKQKFYQLQLIP